MFSVFGPSLASESPDEEEHVFTVVRSDSETVNRVCHQLPLRQSVLSEGDRVIFGGMMTDEQELTFFVCGSFNHAAVDPVGTNTTVT